MRFKLRTGFLPPADLAWGAIWGTVMIVAFIWNAFFLNTPAFILLLKAVVHSLFTGMITVAIAMALGWAAGVGFFFLESSRKKAPYVFLTLLVNCIRSVPQILGLISGYVVLTILVRDETIINSTFQLLWMAAWTSVFLFLEMSDLVTERIRYYRSLDFFPAMLCCGMKPGRIIHEEILLKNSASHLIHKAIALFGTALYLQCSVDFIISVGLTTDVSLTNFPVTLGSLLARMDSKQDILALGRALTDFSYIPQLFVLHLQGLTVAFTIVFSLLCSHHVAKAFVRRKGL